MEDGRCKLGLQGRLSWCCWSSGADVQGGRGRPERRAGDRAPVVASLAGRQRASGRRGRVCGRGRSVPRSCPWALSGEQEQAILSARQKTNWGPMQLQFLTGRHRSTIWKVLARHGVSRQRRTSARRPRRRYEWTEAGALLHIDAFELPKFDRPGHWAHGDRSERHKTRQAGKIKVIGVIDDHTRLAYCEIHAAENALDRLGDAAARRRLVSRAGLRPRAGRHVRQRASATPPATSSATPSPSSAPATS